MRLRWQRVKHWKTIRMLVADTNTRVYAYIQRGRRPNEYTIVFPKDTYAWAVRTRASHNHEEFHLPPYTLEASTLQTAKAMGTLIVKTEGIV